MSSRLTLALGAAAVLAYLGLVLATHDAGLGREVRPGVRSHPFVFEDAYDRLAYQQRGRWLASGGTPYVDEFSEYPQLTTWLVALPYLFFDHGVERGQPFGAVRDARAVLEQGGVPPDVARLLCPIPQPGLEPRTPREAAEVLARYPRVDLPRARLAMEAAAAAEARRGEELEKNREAYGDVHHVLMALWFLALLALAVANLRALCERPAWALLLLLPASLYFGFNRFDLVVTTAVALAIWCQLRGRRKAAACALGAAVMVKWAPIVLVPLFLAYNARVLRDKGAPWRAALARGVLAPGLCAACAIAVPLAVTYLWRGGGAEAVTAAFEWHKNVRQPNHSSLLALLTGPESWGWLAPEARPGLERLFRVLQVAPACLLALLPLRTPRALLFAALTATLASIVFQEFFSPQWVLWITALGLYLAPRSRTVLVLVVALEVVMYAQLPWCWYHLQATGEEGSFRLVTDARMALLLVFLAASLVLTLRAALRPQRPA